MQDLHTLDTLVAPLGQAGRVKGTMVAGRYQLECLLGAGAMGEVWEARHVPLDRVVALKLLGAGMRAAADRLVIEAQALARVRHPAVVEVYDCGTIEDGTPYIAMERLVGETLASAVRRGPLPVAEAVRLFVAILDGLAAAHRAGVIHRDIKPENIILVDGGTDVKKPKLLDFGIARIADGGTRQTIAGALIGTPSYMSPEQFRGERCAEPSDLWSATATLYESIVGRPPFGDENLAVVMHRVLEAPLPYPRSVVGLNGRLWGLLARGLRKLPNERFSSAEAMRDELTAWLSITPPPAARSRVTITSPNPPAHPMIPAEATGSAASPAPVQPLTLDTVITHKLSRG